jgi:hypothetical protein
MVSIAIAFHASFCAVRALVVAIAGDQANDETGDCPSQRDSSHCRQKRQSDAAAGSAAEDESDATGYSQRSQRFFFYIFGDISIAPTPPLICIGDGLC